jgi:hypothetical protein
MWYSNVLIEMFQIEFSLPQQNGKRKTPFEGTLYL